MFESGEYLIAPSRTDSTVSASSGRRCSNSSDSSRPSTADEGRDSGMRWMTVNNTEMVTKPTQEVTLPPGKYYVARIRAYGSTELGKDLLASDWTATSTPSESGLNHETKPHHHRTHYMPLPSSIERCTASYVVECSDTHWSSWNRSLTLEENGRGVRPCAKRGEHRGG